MKCVVVEGSTYVSFDVSVTFTTSDRTQLELLFACYPAWGEVVPTVILIPVLSCDCRRPLLDVEGATYLVMKKVCRRVS
jgi:hypothetical protein